MSVSVVEESRLYTVIATPVARKLRNLLPEIDFFDEEVTQIVINDFEINGRVTLDTLIVSLEPTTLTVEVYFQESIGVEHDDTLCVCS